jgi:hypothetical protein
MNAEQPLNLEITLPITGPLKRAQKEALLTELRTQLAGVSDYKIVGTKYREKHAEGAPIELIVQITTLLASAATIAAVVWKITKWVAKQGDPSVSPGIDVKVDNETYSIKNCKTAEDVKKIIREIKRR